VPGHVLCVLGTSIVPMLQRPADGIKQQATGTADPATNLEGQFQSPIPSPATPSRPRQWSATAWLLGYLGTCLTLDPPPPRSELPCPPAPCIGTGLAGTARRSEPALNS
jgi:hypothetical protein